MTSPQSIICIQSVMLTTTTGGSSITTGDTTIQTLYLDGVPQGRDTRAAWVQ